MQTLNPCQKECVNADGNLLITACPGSGKTTVLSFRSERLLSENPDATLLAVTFTKDASSELKDKILKKIPSAKNRISTGTFHSLCLILLKRANSNLKLLTESQTYSFVQDALSEAKALFPFDKPNIKEMGAFFDYSKTRLYLLRVNSKGKKTGAYRDYLQFNECGGRMYMECYYWAWFYFLEKKQEAGVMDFSDIINLTIEMLYQGKVSPFAANYILGDEAQDMDEIQHELIKIHAKNGTEVTLVGDDDQLIFGFRYASGYKGMMSFLKNNNAKLIELPVNYRCGTLILSKAVKLIKNNKERVNKPIIPGMTFKGTILPVYSYKERIRMEDEPGVVFNREFEVEGVLDLISNHAKNNPVLDDKGDPVPVEWTILTRNNFARSRIRVACFKRRIPCYSESGSIWDNRLVCLFTGVLEYLSSKEWIGLAILISSLIPNIPYLYKEGKEMNITKLYKYLFDDPDDYMIATSTVKSIKYLAYFVNQWQKALSSRSSDGIDFVIKGVHEFIVEVLPDIETILDKTKERWEPLLDEAKTLLLDMSEDKLSRRLFLCQLPCDGKEFERTIKYAKSIKSPLVIQTMTMHKCKGLEWNNVFILGVDDSNFATAISNYDICEERRLLYVAMTRARKTLGFSLLDNKSSTFLNEIDVDIESGY